VIKKKDLSQEDKKTWDDFIKSPKNIYDKDKNNSNDFSWKQRFKFDLHGFTLIEANNKVKELIHFCIQNRYKELLIITGKGIHSTNDKDIYSSKDLGKLKYSVPEFLKNDNDLNKVIISIENASLKDGGEGAILIRLKKL
tara:strand:+ start:630 stop:1049 length:420 start_codon:yes stop_codon:yes gene_type:complete